MRISDKQYDAMHAAMEKAGAEAGRNAAAWWEMDVIGGRASGDVKATAKAVIAGIDDGDFEVMDSLPRLDLSGQWADGPTPYTIYAEVCDEGWPIFDDVGDSDIDDLTDAYRDAYDSAASDAVYEHCQRVAADD